MQLLVALRIGGVGIQGRQLATLGIPHAAVVIRHQVDPVQLRRQADDPARRGVAVIAQAGMRASGDGDQVMAAGRLLASLVEGAAQFANQAHIVFLVAAAVADLAFDTGNAPRGRMLPVDIDAIETMPAHQFQRGSDERLARGRCGGHVRKAVRPDPAAHRQQDAQPRMTVLERIELAQVVGIGLRRRQHDAAIGRPGRLALRIQAGAHATAIGRGIAMFAIPADVGERVLDQADIASANIVLAHGKIGRFPAGIIGHHFRRDGRRGRRGGGGQRQRAGAASQHCM